MFQVISGSLARALPKWEMKQGSQSEIIHLGSLNHEYR
jgi:hypothetical protein